VRVSSESVDSLLFYVPLRILTKTAIGALEHLASLLIALELPVQQRVGHLAKLAAIGLRVSAAVSDAIFTGTVRGHFGDALEVIAMSVESPEM
jgi:hypothetical protein